MLTLKKVAVTGGIASGKTTVCRIFHDLGAYTTSADQLTHHFLSTDESLKQHLISLLGSEVVLNGIIDRKKVAEKVFNSPPLLKKLELLIHPKVFEEIEREWREQEKKRSKPLFVVEMPLLFETPNSSWYDATIAVLCPDSLSKERFCKSTGYPPSEYDKRASRQLSQEEKAKRTSFVIHNDTSKEKLFKEVQELYKRLIT